MTYLLMIHAAGLAGGFLANKLRIPACYLLGSAAFAMLLNIFFFSEQQYTYPLNLRMSVQVFSGIVLGLNFTRSDLLLLRHMLMPALMMICTLLGINILFAAIISHFTELAPITALFATAPGGVTDLALIAADFGADTEQVALLQIFRFVFVVSTFPFVVRRILGRKFLGREPLESMPYIGPYIGMKTLNISRQRKTCLMLLTFLVAASGAALARISGIPAGALIGSLTAVILLNAVAQKAYFPRQTRIGVQIFAGCYIGSLITLQTLLSLQLMILPMLLIIIQVLFMAFGAAWVLRRFTSIDYATSLFAGIPGGISEMGLIAGDMGLNVPQVLMLHTCRIIAVIGVMPLLLHVFSR